MIPFFELGSSSDNFDFSAWKSIISDGFNDSDDRYTSVGFSRFFESNPYYIIYVLNVFFMNGFLTLVLNLILYKVWLLIW